MEVKALVLAEQVSDALQEPEGNDGLNNYFCNGFIMDDGCKV